MQHQPQNNQKNTHRRKTLLPYRKKKCLQDKHFFFFFFHYIINSSSFPSHYRSISNLTTFKRLHPLVSHFLYVRKRNNCLIVWGVTCLFSKLKVPSFRRHTRSPCPTAWEVSTFPPGSVVFPLHSHPCQYSSSCGFDFLLKAFSQVGLSLWKEPNRPKFWVVELSNIGSFCVQGKDKGNSSGRRIGIKVVES